MIWKKHKYSTKLSDVLLHWLQLITLELLLSTIRQIDELQQAPTVKVCDIYGHIWSLSPNGRWIYQVVCYKLTPKYSPFSIKFIFSTYYPLNSHNTHILGLVGKKTTAGSSCVVKKKQANPNLLDPYDSVHNIVTNMPIFLCGQREYQCYIHITNIMKNHT